VPPGVGAWSAGALARLQRLEVSLWLALDQIPPTLAHLSVSNATRAPALLASDQGLAWCGQVVAQLDTTASVCEVDLRALRCAHDLAWLPTRE